MNCKTFLVLINVLLFSFVSYSQTTYFVKYKNDVSKSEISNLITNNQLNPKQTAPRLYKANFKVTSFADNLGKDDENLSRIVKVTFNSTADAQNFIQQIQSDPSVDYVQPSHLYKIETMPNDSLVSQQWGLSKIKAFKAWNITEGSDSVLIGLIDTGIDYLHPDLKNKIYINPGETGLDKNGHDKRTNGIDDDHNGFIDDYMGWDFTDRKGFPFDSSGGDYLNWDNNPMDENGHGTYIAGILGAQTNNGIGVAGTAPNIKVLNIRAFDPSGYGEEDDVAAAILYAVKMGVKVINMSFGDSQFSYVLRDVIKYAYSKNVVLVGSSGNDGVDTPHYPSGYSEVICVGNSTEQDYVASSSNYGSTLDLVAPGTFIMTTARHDSYAEVSGTSASSPFVSASAALILSRGNFTNEEVKQILKSTADDIESPGWDLKSGAGRLNLYRALSVTAPSIVKFNNPLQDFSTKADSLKISATILSAYFEDYSLYLGTGLNPTNWQALISKGQNQFSDKNIYNLDISNFQDSSYCLRLVVDQSNGKTLEERVNFYVNRNPPKADLIFVGPAFYGNKSTILGAMYTNQSSVVRMYYKEEGASNYNYVTLDGFATNIQAVKNLHYGFVPKELIKPNTTYDIHFVAQNLTGLTTTVNNNGKDFQFKLNEAINLSYETEEPFTLPAGEIYKNPISLTSNDSNEVVLRKTSNPRVSEIYKLNGNKFVKIDSLQDKIVKDFGDFNNNGKRDLLTYFVYNGFIQEQQSQNSTKLETKFSDTSGSFWPIMAKDIDKDGKTEVLVVSSDTSITVWRLNNDLTVSNPSVLSNFTPVGDGGNIISSPHAVITDMNGDGNNEIWMVDDDGDIYSYNVLGANQFSKGKSITTGFKGSTSYLASGDFNGDGKPELAVLLHSIESKDIAPFYRLIVFDFNSDSLNVLYDHAFIDPSTEFNSSFQKSENSIRFADIDNDGKDELILFDFPYSYIFKYENNAASIISYKENINSNQVFVGDLNKDGVKDVAFPTSQGIKFYEFAPSNTASTPYNLIGFSVDSSKINLTWNGKGNKFLIYRGDTSTSLRIIDSTTSNSYLNDTLLRNKNYFYAVQAVDYSKKNPKSNLSQIVKVYSHRPARVKSIISETQKDVKVVFSDKINNTIENLQSFKVLNSGYPNSISAADQFSYLLSFSNNLPVGSNKLVIQNLTDYYSSPVKADTLNFVVDSVKSKSEEFFITSHEILNPYKIKIVFNLDVDEQSALNTENYTFTPGNHVTDVSVDPNAKNTIYLNLQGNNAVGSIGKEYNLRIQNVYSSSASGKIKINSGAGSYLVLTSFAKNLSDVYVYPSPARIINGEGKLTFANLPQRAKITIFSLDGKKINELKEDNGDGGLQYDLRDMNGNLLNTGVYIFRIVQLNNSDGEIGEKLGKFAVIK